MLPLAATTTCQTAETYAAFWEVVQSCEVLGDGGTSEERGGNQEGFHLDVLLLG